MVIELFRCPPQQQQQRIAYVVLLLMSGSLPAGWTLLGFGQSSGQLTLSVVQRHVRDLHVAVVAADGPCYAAAAFSGRTVVEIPSSMSSETVNQIGGNGDTTIRSTMVSA